MGIEDFIGMIPGNLRESVLKGDPLGELRRLNDNLERLIEVLEDLRTMSAPWLGFKVKKNKEVNE